MKKIIYFMIITILLVSFNGCSKNKEDNKADNLTLTPSPSPIVTLPPEEVVDEDTSGTDSQTDIEERKLIDYYPIQADTEYVYEGEGNEYASYTRYLDYVDIEKNKLQTRTNNGGTETVRVIELRDGKLSVVYKVDECYYRDSFMDKTVDPTASEVLLMEPLVKGTEWNLPDGRKRYISELEVQIDTPSGEYKALEVTTKEQGGTNKDYYAPGVGLVKSIYSSDGLEVTSSLSKINTDTPFTRTLDRYIPDSDEKLYVEPLTLTFKTGDVTRLVLQEALKKEGAKESYLPLISANTKINSLYLGEDKIVYADFSIELTKDMHLGSGYESLTLEGLTNTLGSYYGVEKVYITVDGRPYESGHILMKKGETFQVNMDNVVRE